MKKKAIKKWSSLPQSFFRQNLLSKSLGRKVNGMSTFELENFWLMNVALLPLLNLQNFSKIENASPFKNQERSRKGYFYFIDGKLS